MKSLLLFFILTVSYNLVFAQNFTGQWKGSFSDDSGPATNWAGNDCDYVLEIEAKGSKVTGFSYTYFTAEGKKFYTICEIEGFINKKSRYIEVRETKRIKTNVPYNIRNCFQVHKLTYFKEGDNETLDGNWIPVPESEKGCGFGLTKLNRRNLTANYPGYKKSTNVLNPTAKAAPIKKSPEKEFPITKVPTKPSIAKKPTVSEKLKPKSHNETVLNKPDIKKEMSIDSNPSAIKPALKTQLEYKKRSLNLMKTISVSHKTIRIDLYDNGEIDGDSISLFFNDRLVLSNQRLSDKAVSLTLSINENPEVNELIMYAENLGTIPPNTALMVVTDGKMRYEVRIDSDLKRSGVIHFILKE